ncbi:hypothetical protein [Nocardia brasiliensis]|uniref:hypothetical protein n=1 Tax=Nocardia brasiliensis TaxID=37326 RepID=UPI002456634C|nr:hypothetical protein [Nocardia brasiliensis]
MAWFDTYERDVNGAPGAPWPTRPRPVLPVAPPDPAEIAVTQAGKPLLGSVLAVIREVVAAVRR